jgi:hypothetical protein
MNFGLEMFPDARSFIQSFGSELAIVMLLFLLRAVGFDLFRRVRWLLRFPLLAVHAALGRRVTLLYTDCDDAGRTTLGLKRAIAARLPGARIRALKNAEDIMDWPVFPFAVEAIIILITDVSPLSSNEKTRGALQRRLERFVHRGGTLVLGHDVLYRRSKNPILQKLAGCRITEFTRSDTAPVRYVLFGETTSPHYEAGLLTDMEPRFALEDREYVTGRWADDVRYVYVLDSPESSGKVVPLVTFRRCGDGAVLWFNSGDSTEAGPPEPLAGPNPAFVQTLVALLKKQRRSCLAS